MKIDWDKVAETLGPRLFRYFTRRGAQNESSDLTQESLIRLFDKDKNGSYDANKGTLDQLGFGIARLVWLEHCRDFKEFSNIEDVQSLIQSGDIEHDLNQKQQQGRMQRLLSKLSDVQKEIVSLVADGNLKMREISDLLQMPEGTVKSHFSRAKQILREELI